MSDAGRLLAAFETGALIRPATGDASTVDLALALAHVCGVEECELTEAAHRIAGLIGEARHIVFILLDGFGMSLLEREPAESPLRQALAAELRAVFPSSTAPALTSLATGLWPAEHAVPGWWTYLPAAGLTATVLPFIERFSEQSLDGRVNPDAAYPAPTLSAAYARQTLRIVPVNIDGSVYSRYSTPAGASRGYRSLNVAVEAIDDWIAAADGDTYTYFYVPFIDTAAHEHGPDSSEVRLATQRVRERIGGLLQRLHGRARVVISADHGQIAAHPRGRHVFDRRDPLMQLLTVPPTCEPRVPAFHPRPGQEEAFAALFRRRLGDHFALLTVSEADSLRLFGRGPLSAETRARLGAFVGVAMERDVLLYEPAPSLAAMQGFHGGLVPDEMRVPLIVA